MKSQYEINRKALTDYLDSQGWNYEDVGRGGDDFAVFELKFNVGGLIRNLRVLAIATDTDIQSIGVSPMNADEDKRTAVGEYINRANYGLKIGKFEMDYSDGEVRYFSILSAKNAKPSHEDVERVVDCPMAMFIRYGNGLVKVMFDLADPASAVAEAEA